MSWLLRYPHSHPKSKAAQIIRQQDKEADRAMKERKARELRNVGRRDHNNHDVQAQG